ncbi:hypothetical protein N9L06_06870 [Mariniblastus sp.]|nr:hypothetical protein [Mariniblastus sp.]
MPKQFSPEVARKLKTYVYRLIDPRNGETFYIGKGNKNRVFEHVAGAIKSDEPTDKLTRIREIIAAGFEAGHVIHRHGMDGETAFHVEAALIDAFPGLTNVAGGVGNDDFGAMHAKEIVQKYEAKVAKFKHKAIMINVNRSAAEQSLYEATRYSWKVSLARAKKTDLVLAVRQGLIIAVFVPEQWLAATADNFPGREPVPGRYGFVGIEADEGLAKKYVGKRVPDSYRKKGAANPIRYTYK